jgi:long-subunit fatty acid transport protein
MQSKMLHKMLRKGGVVSILCIFLLSVNVVFAQNEDDALRFSNTFGAYSNRALGMGGAYTALGADFTNFFQNPAGIAAYKKQNMEFGLSLLSRSTQVDFNNRVSSTGSTGLGVNTFGFTSTFGTAGSGWGPWVYGLAYGRTQSFKRKYDLESSDNQSSLLDVYTDQLNYYNPANSDVTASFPFGAGLAWETYLINPGTVDPYVHVGIDNNTFTRRQHVEERGYIRETAFGVARAFEDKLFVGASFAFRKVVFEKNSTYSESFSSNGTAVNYSLIEDNSTSDVVTKGPSVQAKLGVQYVPSPYVRLGAFWHSACKQSISDNYLAKMESTIGSIPYNYSSDKNVFDYGVQVPATVGVGAALILGNFGIVSADFESTDFSKMVMYGITGGTAEFAAENLAIQDNYKRVHKGKLGTEFRLGDVYRLRAGIGYRTSVFTDLADKSKEPLFNWNVGGGYKKDDFYCDGALMITKNKDGYFLYNPALISMASIDNLLVQVSFSIGVRF